MPVNDVTASLPPLSTRDGENRARPFEAGRPTQQSVPSAPTQPATPAAGAATPASSPAEPPPAVVVDISPAARAQLENEPAPAQPAAEPAVAGPATAPQTGPAEPPPVDEALPAAVAPQPATPEPQASQFSQREPGADEVLGTGIDVFA